ncbi:MAG: riboflavin biosynthesis protein RibF [Pirellulaceae bacterium]
MTRLIRTLDDFPKELLGGALAVGNFDGVHAGHQRLLQDLVIKATELGGPAIVMTFDPPPVAVLVPDRPPTAPLTTIPRRAELLGRQGIDALLAYPTDRALVNLSAEQFFEEKICGSIGALAMVEGPNFRFGKDRLGDTALLRKLCESRGMGCNIVEAKVDESGQMVSSSRIRSALGEGEIDLANQMLTQPYEIEGIVAKGEQRGRKLGFPTANLEDINCLVPKHGVYAGAVELEGQLRPAAIHIGPNITFGEERPKVEVHVLDWEGAIYGERLSCTMLSAIRDLVKFDSAEALVQRLEIDTARSRQIFNELFASEKE